MFIPVWFLIVIIILFIIRIPIKCYFRRKMLDFYKNFVQKHLKSFDSTFALFGKDLHLYYEDNKFILENGNKESK